MLTLWSLCPQSPKGSSGHGQAGAEGETGRWERGTDATCHDGCRSACLDRWPSLLTSPQPCHPARHAVHRARASPFPPQLHSLTLTHTPHHIHTHTHCIPPHTQTLHTPPTHTHTTYSIHTHIQTHTHPAPRIFLHQAPHPLVLPAVAALPTAPQTPCALMVGGWGLGPKATSPPNTSGVSLTAPPTQGLAGLPAATRHTLEREEGSFPMSPAWDGQDSGQPGPGWEEQCEGRRRGRTGSPRTAPQSPSQAPHPAPWPWTSVSRSPRCPGTHSTHGSHVACSEGVLSARLALSCPRRRWQSFSCWQTGDRSVRPHGSAGHRSDSKLEGPVAASLNQRAHIPAGVLHQVTGRRHTGGCPRGLSAA